MSALSSLIAERLARPGRVGIPFEDTGNPDRKLTLEAYRANAFRPGRPVVFVQHGMGRNGDEYRDFWIPAADRHGLLILAVTFGAEAWPTPETYNNGLVFDEAGAVRPREAWGYAVLPRLFAAAREAGLIIGDAAHLFGHSAGAQFVHRMLATCGAGPFAPVIAGNAGWYTLPELDRPFPEGLGGLGLGGDALRRFLATPLTILAGSADTETSGPSLPSHAAALAQGPHRFARAHAFLEAGQAAAKRLGIACAWRLVVADGIGHDGAAMSRMAAGLWFDRLDAGEAAAKSREGGLATVL
ncbi:alpha/beta hydrolase [Elioraea rosea]|uniref:alpha/beta hydrolase n=1 Tax=Elioraea rosea TaxID=2492390 RepID=UPI00118259C0|nr:alpha/beta hydrolase [Elioraea rosea]